MSYRFGPSNAGYRKAGEASWSCSARTLLVSGLVALSLAACSGSDDDLSIIELTTEFSAPYSGAPGGGFQTDVFFYDNRYAYTRRWPNPHPTERRKCRRTLRRSLRRRCQHGRLSGDRFGSGVCRTVRVHGRASYDAVPQWLPLYRRRARTESCCLFLVEGRARADRESGPR